MLASAHVDVIAGVNVGAGTTTDAAGRYTLSNLQTGTMTVRASAAGYVAQTASVTVSANQVTDFSLQVVQFLTNGRVVDVLSAAGLGNITISGDALSGISDTSGAFSLVGATGSADSRVVTFTGPAVVERRTAMRVPGSDVVVSLISSDFDLLAFDQMFRQPFLLRWTSPPPLMIETQALQFVNETDSSAKALDDEMSDAEYASLVADLSWALPQLTGGTFGAFASSRRQSSAPRSTVVLLNSGQITVARVVGLTAATGFWGFSRWQFRSDGTVISGTMMLDRDFERSGNPYRLALRTHELGHALGYNHVTLRDSIMNAQVTVPGPNVFDLEACRIAFQRLPGNRPPDSDPDSASINRLSFGATWSPPIR